MAQNERLISSDALKKEIIEAFRSNTSAMAKTEFDNDFWYTCLGKQTSLQGIMDFIEEMDAVEVVRCKDCKHIETIENSIPYCTWHHSGCGYDDFCSYGERKDNG